MKILIVSTRRTGAYSFGKALAKHFNVPYFDNPYVPNSSVAPTVQKEGCVVRVQIQQQSIEDLTEYCKEFSKVFILTRKHINRVYESLYYQIYMRKVSSIDSYWHESYFLPEFDGENFEFKPELFNEIRRHTILLGEFAYKKKISYLYYEDLFSEDDEVFSKIIERLNLGLDLEIMRKLLHPSKRYRKFKREKI